MSHSVLYIDDSDDNLVLVERILRRREDVRLHVARTGHDGIAAALGDPPSLILLDNRLPDSSGMQVLLQLAASPATAAVPVVVLSGDSGQATVKDLLAAGASGFLAKPFAVGELLAVSRATSADQKRHDHRLGWRVWFSAARTASSRPVEGPAQLQYRDVTPGVQRVVVDQFRQRVVHARAEPRHLRGRQDLLGLRRDHRDDQQIQAHRKPAGAPRHRPAPGGPHRWRRDRRGSPAASGRRRSRAAPAASSGSAPNAPAEPGNPQPMAGTRTRTPPPQAASTAHPPPRGRASARTAPGPASFSRSRASRRSRPSSEVPRTQAPQQRALDSRA